MAKFTKINNGNYFSYKAENKGKCLFIIPPSEKKHGYDASVGEELFYRELHKDLLEEEINETEFRQIAGDMQGAVKNFLDSLNIE